MSHGNQTDGGDDGIDLHTDANDRGASAGIGVGGRQDRKSRIKEAYRNPFKPKSKESNMNIYDEV